MSKVWELVKLGKFNEAILAADTEIARSESVLPLRNKIIALLNLERYQDAVILCDRIIERESGESETDFINLGVSYWLQKIPNDAIAAWSRGKKAKYTDAAGGVKIPLLLFYAAIRMGDKKLQMESIKQLKSILGEASAVNWPGPIAEFMLDTTSAAIFLSKISQQPILRERQICQADFYIAVKHLEQGNNDGLKKFMQMACSHESVSLVQRQLKCPPDDN